MRRLLSLLILVACCACKDSCSPPPPAPPPADPKAEALNQARDLALRKAEGTSVVDAEIGKLQERVQRLPKGEVWALLGQAWVRKARESADPVYYLNANACADLALDADPNLWMGTDLRGLVLLNEHRFEEARALGAQTVAHNPGDPMGYGVLSDALLEMGRYDEATAAAQKMVDLKPNLPSYSRAAYLMWLRNDVKESLNTLRMAYGAGDDDRNKEPRAWVTVQAAIVFWNRGDYLGAEAGFVKALADVPDYPPALVGRAQVALAQNRPADAVALLDKAYKASPLLQTLWLLGDARGAAGDAAGAEQAYTTIAKQARADPRTVAQFLATKNRETDRAVKLALDETKVRDDIYTEDAVAWALYRAKRFDEARAASDKTRILNTPDAKLIYHAGAIRLAQGKSEEGRAMVEEALKLNPAFDVSGAAEAKALLAAH